jgi:hypothetical protein
LRECNCKPKEGLGVRLTPGFSERAAEESMSRRALIAVMIALSSSGAFAQTTQIDPPSVRQAKPDDARGYIRRGDDSLPIGDRAFQARASRDHPTDPSGEDVDATVGLGRSVDVAPRDIREPFDE